MKFTSTLTNQKDNIKLRIYQVLPAILFFGIWEVGLRLNPDLVFYLGIPSQIIEHLWTGTMSGVFLKDFGITFYETFAGFILGNVVGTLLGLSLWFSNQIFRISRPYIVILGATPIFALAPIMILWFGTGIFSKIMIAAFSTVFIALFQAYSGAEDIKTEDIRLMQSFQATKMQIFKKVVAPSSMVWVISALKINVGFALLGAFIGEFLSSNAGLGHMIIVASGLYNISKVLAGVFGMVLIALIMNFAITLIENTLKRELVKVL